ncbi:transposase [Streptomyces sp. NPDC059819]|uniref:transposase n=1 Tax=Streptomyces sp. NPDC059819 TaxID=3346963 RepID=UPI003667C944
MLSEPTGPRGAVQPRITSSRPTLHDIYNAEDKEHAATSVKAFAKQCGAKFPGPKKITDDGDGLLAFCDSPAEHWIHLRTTVAISTLDVCQSALGLADAPATHWGLTHFLLDGHHKTERS